MATNAPKSTTSSRVDTGSFLSRCQPRLQAGHPLRGGPSAPLGNSAKRIPRWRATLSASDTTSCIATSQDVGYSLYCIVATLEEREGLRANGISIAGSVGGAGGAHKPSPAREDSGLGYNTVHRIYANKAKRVDLATLHALAGTLRCEPGELIGRKGRGVKILLVRSFTSEDVPLPS